MVESAMIYQWVNALTQWYAVSELAPQDARNPSTKKIIDNTANQDEANFVITGGTAYCHYDNLQQHHWWQKWHHNH